MTREQTLEVLVKEAESALTWALDKSPEAAAEMVKESAAWRFRALAALAAASEPAEGDSAELRVIHRMLTDAGCNLALDSAATRLSRILVARKEAREEPAEGERPVLRRSADMELESTLADWCAWAVNVAREALGEPSIPGGTVEPPRPAAPRPPSSPDPALCGACGHHRHEPGQCWYQARSLDPICRCAGPAPSPDPGERPDEVQEVTDEGGEPVAYFTRERVNAVAFEGLLRRSRFAMDIPPDLAELTDYEWWREVPCECGDHGCHYAPAVPTDPDAFAVTVWHVEGRGWLSPPAPSPAAAARCTTCGLPMSDPNHAGSPPGCPGPAAVEAPRREETFKCSCGDYDLSASRPQFRALNGMAHRRYDCWFAPPQPQTKEGEP